MLGLLLYYSYSKEWFATFASEMLNLHNEVYTKDVHT